MSWFTVLVKGIGNAYERFGHEQTPLSLLFGNARKENDLTTDDEGIATLSDAEVAGEKSNVITVIPGTRLSFEVRLPPGTEISSWVSLCPRTPSRNGEGVGFVIGVEQKGDLVILAQQTVSASQRSGRCKWHRISADLSEFVGREVTIVLQTSGVRSTASDCVAYWGNPRFLRKRSRGEKISKIGVRLKVGGVSALLTTFLQSFHGAPGSSEASATYQRWIKRHALTAEGIAHIQKEIERFKYRPLISVITPVFNTDPPWLTRCIESVRAQLYPNWELSLFDDGSTGLGVQEILRKYAALDSRIKVGHSPTNLGISRASNEALAMATGDYVATLDHDDELAPEALFEVATLLQEHPEADIIYSDEDKLELDGTRSEPFFKPAWSPEYLLASMYTGHLGTYRRQLVNAVGGLRPGFEGSPDYDLMLRMVEKSQKVFHIPKILYHWRKTADSTLVHADTENYTTEAGRKALREHLQRRGIPAQVLCTDRPNTYRVKFDLTDTPLVSILIPCRDGMDLLRQCLRSIHEKTTYPFYEITIIDNDSSTQEMKDFLASVRHRVVPFHGPFNFSRINNFAARHAKGDYLILLNSDTRVISADWVSALLELTQQKDIGIAGAKLYYPDGRIQHAGVILGLHGVAGHSHKNFDGSNRGYFNALFVTRDCSAVTAACMMIRREVFESVGGLDERLAVCYNDVDLCLRVRQAGYRIVWTPYAELYHHAMISRGYTIDPKEVDYIKARWGTTLLRDPYYNENLTLHGVDFDLGP